ncbi:acylneuraminate cytidylyltransferase family protein [Prosthecochloris sp. CIB 2401]|uniref:acylneuraminate cytidylyltransferase family protein n=1 Tax=Prosthecochloris sp. CIB 2401 TaxID=1868325 RepID=UPI00080AA732|nr:acylneuraminate cytidylyltransferase family protein [Prosthecochloris sp. CIB 2401]ANT64170.1 N-acylneuraminate cytidylyltransferase [Prosthecochloris sp. CIB 2401]
MLGGDNNVLALIPARGGSKGVRRKNLRMIGGKPLLEYTLTAAQRSELVDKTYVSSEDPEILELATSLGATQVQRPADLATDLSSAIEVVQHFIEWLPEELRRQDPSIVYLQPTSPLRTSTHIDAALRRMAELTTTTLLSVTELKASPYKSFTIDESGQLQSLFDEKLSNCRRQDLPKTYIPNGAIYVFRLSDFLERGGFPSNGSVPFVMSDRESVDIDTEEDLHLVEQLLEQQHG